MPIWCSCEFPFLQLSKAAVSCIRQSISLFFIAVSLFLRRKLKHVLQLQKNGKWKRNKWPEFFFTMEEGREREMWKKERIGGSCSWKIFCAMSVMRGCLLFPPPFLPQTTAAAVPFSLPHTGEKIGKRFFFSDTGILLHVGISPSSWFLPLFSFSSKCVSNCYFTPESGGGGREYFFWQKTLRKRDRRERIFIIKIFCRPPARQPGQERRFFKEK